MNPDTVNNVCTKVVGSHNQDYSHFIRAMSAYAHEIVLLNHATRGSDKRAAFETARQVYTQCCQRVETTKGTIDFQAQIRDIEEAIQPLRSAILANINPLPHNILEEVKRDY